MRETEPTKYLGTGESGFDYPLSRDFTVCGYNRRDEILFKEATQSQLSVREWARKSRDTQKS